MRGLIFYIALSTISLSVACGDKSEKPEAKPVTSLKGVAGNYVWTKQQCGNGEVRVVLPQALGLMQIEILEDKFIHTINLSTGCKIVTQKALKHLSKENLFKIQEVERACQGTCSEEEKSDCGAKAKLEEGEIELYISGNDITEVHTKTNVDICGSVANQQGPLKITYTKK